MKGTNSKMRLLLSRISLALIGAAIAWLASHVTVSRAYAGSNPVCPGEGSCFSENGSPGCVDADCCNLVCDEFSFCCDFEWLSPCVDFATLVCEPCATDCNGNQVSDCDEWADCDGNYVMDACDLVLDPDCNLNQIPDECDPDCNSNGVPDDCDLANTTSPDCNGNGIPDECDIVASRNIVFIVDGSHSILPEEFVLQKTGVQNCVCGLLTVIPTDGSTSVGVIQFSSDSVVEIALTLIDSPETAAAICEDVGNIVQDSDDTLLVPALDAAAVMFSQSPDAAHHIFITTDAGVQDRAASEASCALLRSSLGARICTSLVGLQCPNNDPDRAGFLKNCANTTDAPAGFNASQPRGFFRCNDNDPEDPSILDLLCMDCVPSIGTSDDCNFNAVPDECENCPNDCADGDGCVGIEDFLAVLAHWGEVGSCCDTGAGVVGIGIDEFLELLGNWGPCSPGIPCQSSSLMQTWESAGLEWSTDFGILMGIVISGTQEERDNALCWTDHYLDCHTKRFCPEISGGPCSGADPYGGH